MLYRQFSPPSNHILTCRPTEAFNCGFITRFSRKGRELELGINAECALGIQRLQEEVLWKKAIIGKLNASGRSYFTLELKMRLIYTQLKIHQLW